MGLELTLYPETTHKSPLGFCGYDRLSFEREEHLVDQIKSINRQLLDRPLLINDEGGRHIESRDAYGLPLRQCSAGALAHVSSGNDWNNAVLAFVRALPPQTAIVLYWS